MTRTSAGATVSVLRLFDVQAILALVDYSAPVLVTLSQQKMDVIQNWYMPTMLSAQR